MSLSDRVQSLHDQLGTSALKFLSQNFMIDELVLGKLADLIGDEKPSAIIEIGPGMGFLTEQLTQFKVPITAIELDRKLANYLMNEHEENALLKIIHDDFLKVDIPQISQSPNTVLCGNIPYKISSPIIEVILSNSEIIQSAIMTVQKEFAERMVVDIPSRESNSLSVWLALNADVVKISDIDRDAFKPKPKVDSSIVKITPHKKPFFHRADLNLSQKIIKQAFSQRRKKIINNICPKGNIELKQLLFKSFFEKHKIDKAIRAESLSLENWINLIECMLSAKMI